MRANKTLLWLALGALLVGLVASAAQASLEGSADGSPLMVPAGRVGDQVVYVAYADADAARRVHVASSGAAVGAPGARGEGGEHKVEAAPAEGHVVEYVHAYRLERLDRTPDRTGHVHDVLLVRAGFEDADGESGLLQYVDLATRDAIRADVGHPETDGIAYSLFAIHPPSLEGLRHQGQTYRLGQELDPAPFDGQGYFFSIATGTGVSSAGPLPFGSSRSGAVNIEAGENQPEALPEGASVRAWVAQRGVVDGHDAYALRQELVAPARLLIGTDTGDVDPDPDGEFRATRTTWVTADLPYPLLKETRVELDTREGHQVLYEQRVALADYQPGDADPVPWGEDVATFHYRDANPDAERTQGTQLHPADGAGSRLPFPLAQAIAQVQEDPSLLQYQAWRVQNPDAVLVSAQAQPGASSTRDQVPTHAWHLVFAVPDGRGHEVSIERVPGAPRGIAQDHGAVEVPPFRLADLPSNPVTLAAVEQAWTRVASAEYRDRAPNFVHWGLFHPYAQGGACAGSGGFQSDGPANEFARVQVGHTDLGSCLEDLDEYAQSALVMDTATGNLVGAYEIRFDFGWADRPGGPQMGGLPRVQKAPVMLGFQPPAVESAAVATGGALALLLAAYFLPLLKFAAAKALFFLPGYSKLARERVLDNKVRDQLVEVIRQNPGIHASDLARRIDAGWGTVVYHLDVLEKSKLVTSLVDGRHKRFFPVGVVDFGKRGQLAVLMNERTKQLYQLIQESPGIVTGDLAKHVDVTLPSALWHLRRLEDVGLVGRAKKGRRVHYYANETGPEPAPYDPKEAVEVA